MPKRDGISPRDFAAAIGVSESSVKRWVDQGLLHAVRTAGGHRRITPEEATRWLRHHHLMPVDPERLGWTKEDLGALASPTTQIDTFYRLLSAGRAEDARAFVTRAHLGGMSAAYLADELVAPAMRRIGTLWHASAEGIVIEHRATEIVAHIVKELYGIVLEHGQRQRTVAAVGCTLEGDSHVVAAAWTALTLAELGMHVTNLGAALPTHLLDAAARMVNARLVFLTLSVEPQAEVAEATRSAIARLVERDVYVAIGGLHVDALALTKSARVLVATSQVELAEFARRLL